MLVSAEEMKEGKKRKAEFEENESGELLKVKKKHKVKHNVEVDEKDLNEESKMNKAEKKKMRKEKKNRDQSLSDLSDAGKVIDGEVVKKKKKKLKKDKKDSSDGIMGDVSDQKETDNEREKSRNDKDSVERKEKKRKKKHHDEDLGVEENPHKSRKHKEKKKKIKKGDDLGGEENTGKSDRKAEKKRKIKKIDDLGTEENCEKSNRKAEKKRKIKKSDGLGDEENSEESIRKAEKKRKKQKKRSEKAETENQSSNRSARRVSFSDHVDVFPLSETSDAEESDQEDELEDDGLVRGKRFTKEEDELVKKAVLDYVDTHALGEDGVNMVMHCHAHPETRLCWAEIGSSLPWRPRESVYYRAHILFERDTNRKWTPEELERVRWFAEKHGSDWRALGDEFGKHRLHVKDAWRRIRYPNMKKGKWARDEYQTLFDLVNTDLRMKAFEEKKSKHGMLRDNVPWGAISDKLGTRNHSLCCMKWYNQLTSPMVAQGLWDNCDDYRLLDELLKLDACCIEDVEWDNLLENRSGDVCRKRWNQMVPHIGQPVSKSFSEQVEILANRYCPELADAREEFDNKPRVP